MAAESPCIQAGALGEHHGQSWTCQRPRAKKKNKKSVHDRAERAFILLNGSVNSLNTPARSTEACVSRRSGWDIWCGVEDVGHRSSPHLCGSSWLAMAVWCWAHFFVSVGSRQPWAGALLCLLRWVRGRGGSVAVLAAPLPCSAPCAAPSLPLHLRCRALHTAAGAGLIQSEKTCSGFISTGSGGPVTFLG